MLNNCYLFDGSVVGYEFEFEKAGKQKYKCSQIQNKAKSERIKEKKRSINRIKKSDNDMFSLGSMYLVARLDQ